VGEPGSHHGDRAHSKRQQSPPTNTRDLTRMTNASAYVAGLRRRRAACRGASDPWSYPPPGPRGYPAAAQHLLGCGLTPAPNLAALREMWRSGGEQRAAADLIADRWGLAG
jgi:hypothetical protein